MFRHLHRRRKAGFTLIELAIVVAVSGILFAGLWRLIASGNQQLREQAAADQMQNLLSGIRGYLASEDGRKWLNYMPGETTNIEAHRLPLPNNPAGTAGCATELRSIGSGYFVGVGEPTDVFDDLCFYLPPGFTAATTNSFGQTYQIRVRRPKGTGAPGDMANAYEVLIVTQGGETIPDAQGGRLASMMGGAGGFIYSEDNVCNTLSQAGTTTRENALCGAYNSFGVDYTTYHKADGTGAMTSSGGRVGARLFVNSKVEESNQWLSRHNSPANNYELNTMQTNASIFMSGSTNKIIMRGGSIELNDASSSTSGGNINLDSGNINLNSGTINLDAGKILGVGAIDMADGSSIKVRNEAGVDPAMTVLGNDCEIGVGACTAALQVQGSITASKLISAQTAIKGGTFIYVSDLAKKKDIEPLTQALSKVVQLNGYSFKWKENGRSDVGLIAQEVQKIFPELVHGDKPGELGVEYGNLVAPLIEAVKELKQQNDHMAALIATQQKEIDALKASR